jgi:hypothetical protein
LFLYRYIQTNENSSPHPSKSNNTTNEIESQEYSANNTSSIEKNCDIHVMKRGVKQNENEVTEVLPLQRKG